MNETLTKSRTQHVAVGDITLFDLFIFIEHETDPDAILLEVHKMIRAKGLLFDN